LPSILTDLPLSSPFPVSGAILGQAEQRKLETLVRRLQKLPRLQRSILRLLSEHEGTSMNVAMMAAWLSLKESTIRNYPPHDLLKMKLITRTRSSRNYLYTSTLSAFLKREFPQTEPSLIIDLLFPKIYEKM
jgi:Holliday junction resolvasome RuvABC ATP-dependent DNA helicase subunit